MHAPKKAPKPEPIPEEEPSTDFYPYFEPDTI